MKFSLKYSIAFLTIASLLGCKKDFLNRPPLDRVTDVGFFRTEAEVMAATGPLYNIVWFDYNDKASFAIGEMRGGNMVSNDWDEFYKFAVPATDTSTLLPAYKSFYKIVGQTNLTIRNIKQYATGVSETVRNTAIAEARFMRGLAYAYLVRNWGPVPIIYDNIGQLGDQAIVRNTIESVWELIIRDFTFAANHLPATPAAPGRLSKWSGEAMLAKMYLHRAGVGKTPGARSQQDLDSAKFYAGSVIKNSGKTLYPDYYQLFVGKNNNSSNPNPEGLFALQWMPVKEPWGVNNSFQAYMAWNPKVTGTGDGWGNAHGASADLVSYYLNNPQDSVRRKATFMFPGDHFAELNQKAGGVTFDGERANVKKYIVGTPDDNGGKGAQMAAFTNTYMLRLAEVYLIYAEAIMGNNNATSDPEALQYFNAVRKRAGLDPKPAPVTFDDIFEEKRIETAMEGVYWYELVRLYYFDKTKALNLIANQEKGEYTIAHVAGTSNPREYTITFPHGRAKYSATEQTFYLPFPESEMVKAPQLANQPVPFDFSKMPD